ncbi:preprotein translocase subunit Tim44 [Pelagivirga sediminicola]|uniref:Preprotein translocase subunit Tim44 n=1 Tax=Pelagivirga sediminicola TaxID=2170575 RepID=A0A2T7G8P5_9RHOB|nr:Tim44/TimA family putative adaptor protein [Pelagivirga sediminicola]PVA10771.1 preprotein translocase subunit Tim44 [Pelagivirga sediminicola]
MNSPVLQLLVLAGIAVFLILRLRSVLGTREGHEPTREVQAAPSPRAHNLEVIEGGPDHDIIDHVPENSDSAAALADMKRAEPSFGVTEFLGGARGAYEMILMAFERGDIDDVRPFMSEDVYNSFAEVIAIREEKGLTVESEFIGIRDLTLSSARFDAATRTGEITVRFVGELISVVRGPDGEVIEGEPGKSKRQRDVWTFERVMGADDPNWRLVATGE